MGILAFSGRAAGEMAIFGHLAGLREHGKRASKRNRH
jgi:hypothetical protein